MSLLLSKKPGPWTGHVLNQIVIWQLGHPQGTKDECAAWLKEEVDTGKLTLDSHQKPSQEQVHGHRSKKVKLSKDV